MGVLEPGELNQLLRPHVICVCKQVSEKRILEEIARGARTFGELQLRTACSTGCGTCEMRVRALLQKELDHNSSSGESEKI